MIKLRLSQKELEDVITDVLEQHQLIGKFPPRGIFGEMLNKNIMTEGLITTNSPNGTISILNNSKLKFYNIRARRLPCSTNNKTVYNIVLYFDNGLHNIGTEYFNNILHLLDVCGWYPSIIYVGDDKINNISNETYKILKEYNKPFDMICEAKFDIKVDDNDLPDKLYHITNKRNLEKIQKNGLTPKNKVKVSYHPERVYLFDSSVLKDSYSIANHFYSLNGDGDKEFVLLEVDIQRLRSMIDFYYDSNTDLNSFYTLEPIHPFLVRKIKDINID